MKRKQLGISVLAIILMTVAFLHFGSTTARADQKDSERFTVDVTVDHETFAIVPSNGLVLHPEALGPNRGTTFIVDGKVFPGGTLQKGDGQGSPGMAGSIGNWSCKGFFTSDLTASGSADNIGFDTTQRFEFNGDVDAIWTEGLEAGLGKPGVITHRTILGGTGRFNGVHGQVIQEALGTNSGGTPNIRVTFLIDRDR